MPQVPAAVETPAPPVSVSGGDVAVVYDFVEGADVPTWRIWFEGKVITVRPNDAEVVALLDGFAMRRRREGRQRSTAPMPTAPFGFPLARQCSAERVLWEAPSWRFQAARRYP